MKKKLFKPANGILKQDKTRQFFSQTYNFLNDVFFQKFLSHKNLKAPLNMLM